MKTLPPISDAESHVMEQLWQSAPQAAEDLAATLGASQGWQPSTVKTLLNRLLQKGAVSAERDGRRFLYSPLVERQAWLGSQSISLIDRLFGGGLAPLVAQFASQRKLSKADVAALKALLKEQGHD
ncbi:BlaI/MecI/CopY family transcriptional regulator [Ideonella margarita]|uniref:BlaI/MecI/CopY family transcriptional regulator n=1 Tax=Ideonella margarita TaxID=2984191 RepID=A0ABU9C695_9BURK